MTTTNTQMWATCWTENVDNGEDTIVITATDPTTGTVPQSHEVRDSDGQTVLWATACDDTTEWEISHERALNDAGWQTTGEWIQHPVLPVTYAPVESVITVLPQDIDTVANEGRKTWRTDTTGGTWELTRADLMAIDGEWDGDPDTLTGEQAALIAADLNERQPWQQW